jgi:hypothetical protein
VHLVDRANIDRAINTIATHVGVDQAAKLTDSEFEQLVRAANP